MANESSGNSQNPRMYDLIKDAPKTGKSPTIWSFPAVVGFMKVAGQPVSGPWPPHQQPRPDPEDESLPVAIVEPRSPALVSTSVPAPTPAPTPAPPPAPTTAPTPAPSQPRRTSGPAAAAANYQRQDTARHRAGGHRATE